MAALMVQAELKFRDGQREKLTIKVENSLTSLASGIKELNANVSQLLTVLVEQEKSLGHCAEGEEDEDNSDEEDERPEERHNLELQPPTKRSKT